MRTFSSLLRLLLVFSFPLFADMYNHKIILVGDKAAALGGAFTGLADDATATYYNPAGLTQIKNIKLNVSAQIIQYQKQQIEIAPSTVIPYNSFNFSPSITAFSQRMGKWAYGFSVVTPQNDLFTGEQNIQGAYRDTSVNEECYELPGNPKPCFAKVHLSYYEVPKITMIGPSGAMKFNDNISLGASLYAIYFTELEKTDFGSWNANFLNGDTTKMSRFRESNVTRQVNQTGIGFTGTFGILVRMNQGFSFGVSASPGSLDFITRLEEQRIETFLNERLATIDQIDTIPTRAYVYNLSKTAKHTEVSAPSLSIGVSWHPIERLMLTAQTDYYLGSIYSYTGYTTNDDAAIKQVTRSGFEYYTPVEKTYTIEKKSVVNFCGGAEVQVLKGYSLAASGFTDFSQGPTDSREASWNRNIDYFGGTLSLGMDKEFTESRFGISAAYGDASITHFQWTTTIGGKPDVLKVTDKAGNSKTSKVRQNFDAYNFGIFISSTLKI